MHRKFTKKISLLLLGMAMIQVSPVEAGKDNPGGGKDPKLSKMDVAANRGSSGKNQIKSSEDIGMISDKGEVSDEGEISDKEKISDKVFDKQRIFEEEISGKKENVERKEQELINTFTECFNFYFKNNHETEQNFLKFAKDLFAPFYNKAIDRDIIEACLKEDFTEELRSILGKTHKISGDLAINFYRNLFPRNNQLEDENDQEAVGGLMLQVLENRLGMWRLALKNKGQTIKEYKKYIGDSALLEAYAQYQETVLKNLQEKFQNKKKEIDTKNKEMTSLEKKGDPTTQPKKRQLKAELTRLEAERTTLAHDIDNAQKAFNFLNSKKNSREDMLPKYGQILGSKTVLTAPEQIKDLFFGLRPSEGEYYLNNKKFSNLHRDFYEKVILKYYEPLVAEESRGIPIDEKTLQDFVKCDPFSNDIISQRAEDIVPEVVNIMPEDFKELFTVKIAANEEALKTLYKALRNRAVLFHSQNPKGDVKITYDDQAIIEHVIKEKQEVLTAQENKQKATVSEALKEVLNEDVKEAREDRDRWVAIKASLEEFKKGSHKLRTEVDKVIATEKALPSFVQKQLGSDNLKPFMEEVLHFTRQLPNYLTVSQLIEMIQEDPFANGQVWGWFEDRANTFKNLEGKNAKLKSIAELYQALAQDLKPYQVKVNEVDGYDAHLSQLQKDVFGVDFGLKPDADIGLTFALLKQFLKGIKSKVMLVEYILQQGHGIQDPKVESDLNKLKHYKSKGEPLTSYNAETKLLTNIQVALDSLSAYYKQADHADDNKAGKLDLMSDMLSDKADSFRQLEEKIKKYLIDAKEQNSPKKLLQNLKGLFKNPEECFAVIYDVFMPEAKEKKAFVKAINDLGKEGYITQIIKLAEGAEELNLMKEAVKSVDPEALLQLPAGFPAALNPILPALSIFGILNQQLLEEAEFKQHLKGSNFVGALQKFKKDLDADTLEEEMKVAGKKLDKATTPVEIGKIHQELYRLEEKQSRFNDYKKIMNDVSSLLKDIQPAEQGGIKKPIKVVPPANASREVREIQIVLDKLPDDFTFGSPKSQAFYDKVVNELRPYENSLVRGNYLAKTVVNLLHRLVDNAGRLEEWKHEYNSLYKSYASNGMLKLQILEDNKPVPNKPVPAGSQEKQQEGKVLFSRFLSLYALESKDDKLQEDKQPVASQVQQQSKKQMEDTKPSLDEEEEEIVEKIVQGKTVSEEGGKKVPVRTLLWEQIKSFANK